MTLPRTTPPGRMVILFDGHCRFCTKGASRLADLVRGERPELADFQRPGVLERFPGLTHDRCMERLHLVTPDGRVWAGVEAIVAALRSAPLLGTVALLYYLPGLRFLIDRLYHFVAVRRYRLMGRCEGGTCSLHHAP